MTMKKKLEGQRVVLTRARGENWELEELLKRQGATVLELPLITLDFEESDESVAPEIFESLGEYDWLIFTSAHGVRGFFKQFFARFNDLRYLGPCKIACVGPATSRAVTDLHLEVNCMPETHTGLALSEKLLEENDLENLKICVVTGNLNGDALATALTERGRAIVDSFPVYATGESDLSEHPAVKDFCDYGADYIVFASGSAVKSFVSQAGTLKLESRARKPRVIAIGKPTAGVLREVGIPVAAIAKLASSEGLLDAILELA